MKTKKILLIVLTVIVIMFANVAISFATSRQNIQNRQGELTQDIRDTERELERIGDRLSETMDQVQRLTNEIAGYQNQIDDLNQEIGGLENQLQVAEVQLAEAEARYERQSIMLQERLIALYMAGETTFLDVLFSSSGVVEFISNFFLVSEIAEFDQQLLNQMESNRQEIESAKEVLETGRDQLQAARRNVQSTQNSLRNSQSTMQAYANNLSAEEREMQQELARQQQEQRDLTARLRDIERREREEAERRAAQNNNNNNNNNNSGSNITPGAPSQSGFIWPVGRQFRINMNYPFGAPSRGGGTHLGVDFVGAGINGTPIFAVADGTVVISTALRNANGTLRSYGEYIVINHGNGIMTLYAHGLEGSRTVSVGDTVRQGQTIMRVGSTGNSTGPHLHFEVRQNGRPVNPMPWL